MCSILCANSIFHSHAYILWEKRYALLNSSNLTHKNACAITDYALVALVCLFFYMYMYISNTMYYCSI